MRTTRRFEDVFLSNSGVTGRSKTASMILDNLEYLSIHNQVTAFPKHFHETFCISLIHSGVEQIDFVDQSLYSEAGSITITNPYEIHSNPLIDNNILLQFDTIYVSKDLMKYLFHGKNIRFNKRKINDKHANRLFIQLKRAIDFNDVKTLENALVQFGLKLKQYAEDKEEDYDGLKFNNLTSVKDYIDHHIEEKFNLEDLSKIVNINKYGFAKKFKTSTGMSVMNYILMKKIFSSKKIITEHSELTQIAIDYQFSDMAHFSKTFKRYVGVSPKVFQKSLSSS